MEYLANREYRYFSPVLRLDADSRRPMALMHLGLTNVPAIKHLPPLVARCGGDTATLARPAELVQAKEADGMTAWLKEFLGLPAEAEDAAVLAGASAALKELAQGLDLADAASAFQVRGAVLALKAGGEGLRAAQEELLALKARQAQAEAAQAVTLAMKAGKVSPAQKEWALEYFRRDPEGFRTFAAHAPKLLPTGEALQWPEADDRPGDSLVPTEMAVCRLLKVSPEEYLKAKAQINKAQ
jgi:phage I-like protein